MGRAMCCSTQSGLHSSPPRRDKTSRPPVVPFRLRFPSPWHLKPSFLQSPIEKKKTPHPSVPTPHSSVRAAELQRSLKTRISETYVRSAIQDVNSCVSKGASTVRTWSSTAAQKMMSTSLLGDKNKQVVYITKGNCGLCGRILFGSKELVIFWRGVRPPPCSRALRQVTALLSPAPLRMRMLCIGGKECLEGGRRGAVYEEEKRKGVVRQALQTLCSGGTSEKPSHISR